MLVAPCACATIKQSGCLSGFVATLERMFGNDVIHCAVREKRRAVPLIVDRRDCRFIRPGMEPIYASGIYLSLDLTSAQFRSL